MQTDRDAAPLYRATVDGKVIIILYGDAGQLHETAFKFTDRDQSVQVVSGNARLQTKSLASDVIAVQYTIADQTVIQVGSKAMVYIVGGLTRSQLHERILS